MELAEQTDPEEWQAIMERFFAILCAGVHRFEGTVDKFTGDGIMALFGAPIAHEDHAQRACYAALHLQRELAALRGGAAAQPRGSTSRCGWASTRARSWSGAIGEDLRMDYTALGHTVGLAQRMEQLAAPGKVYLTEHTAALVDGLLRAARPRRVRGQGRQRRRCSVHELDRRRRGRGRLDVSRARGFSRFVGRDEELRMLERRSSRRSPATGR